MASEENITIQISEIITKFLSDNFIYIIILTLLIICRKAISNLVNDHRHTGCVVIILSAM